MPHLFFITEKWCDGNPACARTNSEHNLFGSLESSGLATHECFHFDEFFHAHGTRADEAIIKRLRTASLRPDAVIATPLWGCDLSPDPTTYERISATGLPLIFLWFDAVHDHMREWARQLSRFAVASIAFDLSVHDLFDDPAFVPMWTPQDTRIFHDAGRERTIDVSFAGSLGCYPDRREALARLPEAGINVFQSGGQREMNLGVREYAAIHQRSKIALNFAKAPGTDRTQVKGRAFEATHCGSMLLEEDNVHIRRWFEPGKDYVPFVNPADLIDKVRYYLGHPEERQRIANNGHEKATRLYNEKAFWQRVLTLAARKPRRRAASSTRAVGLGGLVRKALAQPLHRLPARVWRKVRALGA
jgi:hypothetical protein